MDNKIIPKLKEIIDKPIKYYELCETLDLPKVGTRQKDKQLKELQMYCDFEVLTKPTKYLIKEVYEAEVRAFAKINGNNKYQTMFDAIVYQAFLENGGQPLYVSTLDMLKLFSEVNENFAYTCSSDNMEKLGEDFIYFTEMGQIAKKMLGRWTKDRIDNMAARSFIDKGKAYRLYIQHHGQYGAYRIRQDIDISSDLGKQCMAIMAQAIEEIVPNKYMAKNEQGENVKLWMPLPIYQKLHDRVAELINEKTQGQYCDLKEILVLRPPQGEWIRSKLTEIYNQLPALHDINTEVCRKILSSTSASLDKFTGAEKKRFIDVNIKPNPRVSLKAELEKIKQEKTTQGN